MIPPSPLLTPSHIRMKPPSPMLAPEQRPLKPATPLQPKNARKTPISHPQRRWRFHLRLGLREQRRRRFQLPPHRPAKATPVSRQISDAGWRWRGLAVQRANARATHQRPGAAGVEGAGGTGGTRGPGCGARGRRRGLAGLRGDAPSEARGADGSRAGRRPRAHQAARPHSRIRRRPEHQRRHKHHRTGKPQNSS